MFQLVLFASIFICFASLAGGIALVLRSKQETGAVEDRLASLTSNRGRGGAQAKSTASILTKPLEDVPNKIEEILSRFLNLQRFIEQSGVEMSAGKFTAICGGLGTASTVVLMIMSPYKLAAPFVFLGAAFLPLLWLFMKRRKRLKLFSAQLANAMDVMGRALRSGYSLPAGIQLVGQQMSEPLGPEFMKCFEQQNLGMSVEESIRDMTERVPNLDLRFFATAVILQRQTGGDLAEILEKISGLIRERFKIWGQIQALTGEGRLSGIVLLALPPALFMVMLQLNYDYVMMLFNDPLGQKMLGFAIVMQVIGALVIKKIITIKV